MKLYHFRTIITPMLRFQDLQPAVNREQGIGDREQGTGKKGISTSMGILSRGLYDRAELTISSMS
jgi:hypothetical protein